MFELGESAIEKFETILSEKPDKVIRLTVSEADNTSLEFLYDNQRKGDELFKNQDGKVLLTVKKELAESLKGMKMEYNSDSGKDGRFIFKRTTGDEN